MSSPHVFRGFREDVRVLSLLVFVRVDNRVLLNRRSCCQACELTCERGLIPNGSGAENTAMSWGFIRIVRGSGSIQQLLIRRAEFRYKVAIAGRQPAFPAEAVEALLVFASLNAPGRTRTCNPRFRRPASDAKNPANTGLYVSIFYVGCVCFQSFGTDLVRHLRKRITQMRHRLPR